MLGLGLGLGLGMCVGYNRVIPNLDILNTILAC